MPIQTLKVGALGTHKTLGPGAGKAGARFLLASTSEVYGDPLVHPQTRIYWGNVNPVGPRGVYDESKRFAEALTMAYHRYHGVDTRIVRIFNTYGPRMRADDGRVVPNFICQALRGEPLTVYDEGTRTRAFCYVDDMVEGIGAPAPFQGTRPVNLGNPDEISVLELAHRGAGADWQQIGHPVRDPRGRARTADDPKVRCPDISKAQSRAGLGAHRCRLEEGLAAH